MTPDEIQVQLLRLMSAFDELEEEADCLARLKEIQSEIIEKLGAEDFTSILDIPCREHAEQTLLNFAVSQDYPKIVRYLIECGSKITRKDFEWAVDQRNLPMLQVMVENGGINVEGLINRENDISYFSPLVSAAEQGVVPIVDYLLEHGISQIPHLEETLAEALYQASRHNHLPVVKSLIQMQPQLLQNRRAIIHAVEISRAWGSEEMGVYLVYQLPEFLSFDDARSTSNWLREIIENQVVLPAIVIFAINEKIKRYEEQGYNTAEMQGKYPTCLADFSLFNKLQALIATGLATIKWADQETRILSELMKDKIDANTGEKSLSSFPQDFLKCIGKHKSKMLIASLCDSSDDNDLPDPLKRFVAQIKGEYKSAWTLRSRAIEQIQAVKSSVLFSSLHKLPKHILKDDLQLSEEKIAKLPKE